jgi:hypothetical protein
MDADSLAAVRTFEHAITHAHTKHADGHGHGPCAFSSPRRAAFTYAFANYALLRVQDEIWWDVTSLDQRSHPPAPIREHIMGSTIFTNVLEGRSAATVDDITATFGEAMLSCEEAFGRLLGREPILDGIHGALHESSKEDIQRLLACWRQIRPQLDSMKRGTWLPP